MINNLFAFTKKAWFQSEFRHSCTIWEEEIRIGQFISFLFFFFFLFDHDVYTQPVNRVQLPFPSTVALLAACQLSTGHRWRTSRTGHVVITGPTHRDKPTNTAHFHTLNWEFRVISPTPTQEGPSMALNQGPFIRSGEILAGGNNVTLFLCHWGGQRWILQFGELIFFFFFNCSFKSPRICACSL